MAARKVRRTIIASLAACSALALAACGSSKTTTVIENHTVTQRVTAPRASTAAPATTEPSTTSTTPTTTTASGATPALNGTYGLNCPGDTPTHDVATYVGTRS